MGKSGQRHPMAPLYPHCTGGWVGPRAGLDTEARGKILLPLSEIESRPLGRTVRSQTLYRLRYPGSQYIGTSFNIYECVVSD
jgi:hypothetical protein